MATNELDARGARPRRTRRRPHAGSRHRSRGDVRGERRAGCLLLHPCVRLHGDRLRGPRDRQARPRLARARAGAHPPRAHRHPPGRRRDRRPPGAPRRRRSQDRAERPRRGARLQARRRARRARPDDPALDRGRARPRAALLDRHLRRDPAPVRAARGLQGRVPARLREARRGNARSRRHAPDGDRPHRRQRGARPHAGVGRLLRARLRHDRDDPLLGRGDLHRVLGADVEGRDRRQRPPQVPDQRARRGQAQVADRGVHRVLQGRRRPAHRGGHARHRGLRGRAA